MIPAFLRPHGVARRGLVCTSLLCAGVLAMPGSSTEVPLLGQTFRSSVDLIAVDVQVLNRAGEVVTALGPDRFEVTLDGQRRRVVSVDLTKYDIKPLSSEDVTGAAGTLVAASDAEPTLSQLGGRTFIIAIDTASFRNLDIRPALLAADRFTRRLLQDDSVGVVLLPNGPRLTPTTSHATARQLVHTAVGRKNVSSNQVEMTLEQVIDITAAAANQSYRAARASVGQMFGGSRTGDQFSAEEADPTLECAGTLLACTEAAITEALGLAAIFEQDVIQGLAGLDALLRQLQDSPGRKTVLLLSGGMPVSDRSGGRPALADEVRRLGEQATYANATIHTLYFDPELTSEFGVDSRQARRGVGRSRVINTRALAEFSEPSGGSLIEVSTGVGESEIDRLIAQTSTYYVLGVEPEARDRDGRPHRLRVRVNQRDVSVRSRQLVVVPRSGG